MAVLTAVALGSNIPPRGAALLEAASLIGRLPETTVTARSGIYETEPVGGPRQGLFLNAALLVETGLGPSPLLEHFVRGGGGIFRAPSTSISSFTAIGPSGCRASKFPIRASGKEASSSSPWRI